MPLYFIHNLSLIILQILKDALENLNRWEDQMLNRNIGPEEFLTILTAEGLRVPLKLTIDLSQYMLENVGYAYVLTGKMCQDPLEV